MSEISKSDISLKVIGGQDILPWLDDLVKLRLNIFREFPYLYEGDVASERHHLQHYARTPRSVFVLAVSDSEVVGVSTGLPLQEANPTFQQPFMDNGIDMETVFHFGESVLDKRYRGLGVSRLFFDEREACAEEHGYAVTSFCVLERSSPISDGFKLLEEFWQSRGYRKHSQMHTRISWLDIGNDRETQKIMTYWLRTT